jgi:hypothetical protein
MASSQVDLSRTTSRFVLNPAGLKELANRNQTGVAMQAIGATIAAKAEAGGGRFTKGYDVAPKTVELTAGVRVGTDYPFAHWDEWGSLYRTPRAPLRRALSSLGLLTKTRLKGKG